MTAKLGKSQQFAKPKWLPRKKNNLRRMRLPSNSRTHSIYPLTAARLLGADTKAPHQAG